VVSALKLFWNGPSKDFELWGKEFPVIT